jgi:periplasmic protein TonB
MVAIPYLFQSSGARWVNYLVLSLIANALLICFVSVESKTLSVPNTLSLKVNLMSFNTPKPIPVKEAIPPHSPSPVKTKKVITEKKAIEVIKKQESKLKTKTEIKKKTVLSQEIIPVEPENNIAQKKMITPGLKENISPKIKKEINPLLSSKHKTNKQTKEGPFSEIKEATYRKQFPPTYPRRALELGQQGNIILHALVKPDGFPAELKIIDSSGHSLLDKAALAAVRKWEFEPTNNNGTAITDWVRVPIEFVIQ